MTTAAFADGLVPDASRQADILAIQDLVVAYGFAVDDRDWGRWAALFTPDAWLDYRHSGGIAGTIDEVAPWMADAMPAFAWSLHSVLTQEIRFTGDTTAVGRVHLFNRNGVEWNGKLEMFDVGGRYLDEYRRVGNCWKFSQRVEESLYIVGGEFAGVVRDLARSAAPERTPPMG